LRRAGGGLPRRRHLGAAGGHRGARRRAAARAAARAGRRQVPGRIPEVGCGQGFRARDRGPVPAFALPHARRHRRRMAKILEVLARSVWDSRGRPTVEAEVAVKGARGRAIAPAGASTGSGEAKSIEVRQAVHLINTEIGAALKGKALEQESIDLALIALDGTPDKSRLGGNAIVAVSLACAHA